MKARERKQSNGRAAFDRLEAERVKRRINEAEFARDVLGLKSQQVWANWKNAERDGVPITAAPDICRRLGWSLDYLWYGRGSDRRVLDPEQEQVLEDLAQLLPEDRAQFIEQLSRAATKARRYRETVST